MASVNVTEWIQKNIEHVGDSAIEVGSKRYKEHAYLDLREILVKKKPTTSLIGCDLSPGSNVDIVLDLTAPLQTIEAVLPRKKFDTIFCISVLEHIPNVFKACENISSLLNPGGSIFISVPFVFRYHGYPGDLWRFTPEAINFLFPEVDFADYRYSSISTLDQDDQMSLKGRNIEKMNRFLYRPKSREEKIRRKQAKLAGEVLESYSLAPAMINMLGFKRQA